MRELEVWRLNPSDRWVHVFNVPCGDGRKLVAPVMFSCEFHARKVRCTMKTVHVGVRLHMMRGLTRG